MPVCPADTAVCKAVLPKSGCGSFRAVVKNIKGEKVDASTIHTFRRKL